MEITYQPTGKVETLKKQLHTIVTALGDFDYTALAAGKSACIFDGLASLSLFYYNLYLYSGEERHYRLSLSYFEQAYHRLDFSNLNFSYGSSGVMWLLNYYKEQRAFAFDFEGTLLAYDRSLVSLVAHYKDNLDPMHGLLSIGKYLLQRHNEYADKGLEQIVDLLYADRQQQEGGSYWESDTKDPDSERHVNMGYAHGIPAILVFLGQLYAKGIAPERTGSLLHSTQAYMAQHREPDAPTHFPNFVQGSLVKKNHKIAYCYGDLGISCGLRLLSKLTGNKEAEAWAKSAGLNIAGRALGKDPNAFQDIGLCHGTAGNAHMFLKLYRKFRHKPFYEAALKQFEDLVALQRQEGGIEGFFSIDYNHKTERYSDTVDFSLINGTVGVGLSILSYLNYDRKNNWDAILALS